jgi:ATP-dependent DNA helicase RecG
MVDILVGTHTLFQKGIDLPNNVGLFVIDEQHNFGVEQRANLLKKSANADILMMSATPIPRTMIMALYGDISVSRITTKPADRLPIQTKVISFAEKYTKLVEAIKRKINDNEKIYRVCPLVDESEKLDYIDVKTRYNDLCNYIDKNKVCLLHGKMSQEQKDKAMNDFKNGDINLLISTTVIEVGIDVPDATVIVIENAEKFGLAQLHQLRGRVGRGSKQSYCFLLYGDKITDTGKKRLEILKNNSDGFIIADEDLKIRGGGTILDKKQSGFNNTSFINFIYDKDIISFLNSIDLSLLDDKKIQPIIRLFYHNNENITNFIAS